MRLVLTIGWNTLREVVRHPVYYVVVGLFVLLCSLSYVLNVFQLHEDVTGDVLQMGVASMSLCALCLAAIGSSRVIYEEIEKRTVLTVLSKPIDRERFLLGKFVGIIGSVMLALIVLFGVILAVALHAGHQAEGELGLEEIATVIQLVASGALLALIQASILTALTVVISVWFPFEVNAVLLVLFFFSGHMVGRVKSYFVERGWTWVGNGIYYLIPNLEGFSIDRAIAVETTVSTVYLGWAAAYGMAITSSILFVGLLLFRERELA